LRELKSITFAIWQKIKRLKKKDNIEDKNNDWKANGIKNIAKVNADPSFYFSKKLFFNIFQCGHYLKIIYKFTR